MPSLLGKISSSLPIRLTGLLVCLVTLSIVVVAGLGYTKLFEVTEDNAAIRIDRAAKAASSTLAYATDGVFAVERDAVGHPLRLHLTSGTADEVLRFSAFYDSLLAEIGVNNQGAANLFRFNTETSAFDRFVTTFRRPDGSMPPAMSIGSGHPAFVSLAAAQPFLGEVPVMGRMRLAYLTPILDVQGNLAGALAVDVGWADDLLVARDDLRSTLFGSAAVVLIMVAGFGIVLMTQEMHPLRRLAEFANDVASSKDESEVPFLKRRDEVGALAHGLARVAKLQDKLGYLAYTDTLTGRGNRARYFNDLSEALRASQTGSEWVLLHINLNRFGRINAAFGSSCGDQVLRHVGDVIAASFGSSARIARQGDDDFAVLLKDYGTAGDVSALCRDFLSRLADPMPYAGAEIQLGASIGICLLPQDATNVETAIAHANLALRAARVREVESFCFFSHALNDDALHEMNLEAALRKSLEDGGLSLHFQPQMEPKTHRLFGVEALARWTHPTEGSISPTQFIPIAERTGLIVDLGDWVLNESCSQARKWLDEGFEFDHVAVNVSPVQLWQQGFAAKVQAYLQKHNLDGRYLCLEMTESVLADRDDTSVAAILGELRALGLSLSLDDFGSGYSSLGYLNRLPFDQLKIDRTFVKDTPKDQQRAKLLEGVVALGKGLGMSIVAEGAETADELDLVRDLGVNAVQGFYYARAVPAQDLAQTLKTIEATVEARAIDADDAKMRLSA